MNDNDPKGNAAPPAADEVLDLVIDKLVTGGAGLARHDGQAVFVPLTAPGDRVRARVTVRKKGFRQAELVEVVEPGPARREAPCPYFGECGGCDLQHLEPAAQRQAKAAIVLDCFQRLGRLDVAPLLEGPADGPELGYRNRIRLFAHPSGPYGLMRRGTKQVVPLEACLLMPEQFNRDILPWLRMMPPVEQILVRLDGRGRFLLSLFGPPARQKLLKRILAGVGPDQAPTPGCTGILFNNLPVWGHDYLVHEIDGHTFKVAAQSFFQGNHGVTGEAVATAQAWLDDLAAAGRLGPLLADLFCGVGLFSLCLADRFARVVAVDSDEGACRDLENNVQRDAAARGKVTVHAGPVAKVLAEADLATDEAWREACCVVDPPRTGLGKDAAAALAARAPRQVLFMSCDPATLARDAALLVAAGYTPTRLRVLDMFPQTAHIETLLLMERDE
ncbi:MAG: class I SAM-dependent RNA methyltransferase [Candidatus Krumholzibacteriia bacterium]